MCFLFSLIPATAIFVVGYFVLFSSTKAEGVVHKLGRVLAIWVFVLASFFPVMGAYMTFTNQCMMERMMIMERN